MANIIINDILNELREENNRLFNENKRINELLDNYRKCLLLIKNNLNDLQNVCKCSENSKNQILYESIKIKLNYFLKTSDNNQESNNENKFKVEDKEPEDMDTTQDFVT